jgi:hypothetical protein
VPAVLPSALEVEAPALPSPISTRTASDRNVEEAQYPRVFQPTEQPPVSRFASALLSVRPRVEDPFGGEHLPSPYAASDSSGTPSPSSPAHTHALDLTLVGGDDEDADEDAKPVPLWAPAYALEDAVIPVSTSVSTAAPEPVALDLSSAPGVLAGAALALDTAPAAGPFALRNVQMHSPVHDRRRAGMLRMTPVRGATPVEAEPLRPALPEGAVSALELGAAVEERYVPEVVSPVGKHSPPGFVPASADLKEGVYQLRNIRVSRVRVAAGLGLTEIVQTGAAMDLSAGDKKSVLGWYAHGAPNQLVSAAARGREELFSKSCL